MSCLQFRQSKTFVIVVVFMAMMLDLIMLTTLEPILPDLLHQVDKEQGLWQPPNTSLHVTNNVTNSSMVDAQVEAEFEARIRKSPQVGLILAIKPGTEMVANVIVGFIVDRFGHKYPMVIGCFGNFLATVSFAFGYRLEMFLAARIIQAIGSSFSIVSGLALLACAFPDDKERARANGIAFCGLSIGMILGFPFGSTCYQFLGRQAPFFILASLMLLDGVLRLAIVLPTEEKREKKSDLKRFSKLISDPYILIALGCNLVLNLALGVVISTCPAWMLDTLHAEQWNIGLVLVVGAAIQLLAQAVTGLVSVQLGRWLFCVLGLIVYALGMVTYPFCKSIWAVIGAESVARLGYGVVLAVISPLLAFLVDLRHDSYYGAVYGLYAASYNLGFCVGPLGGGILVRILSFKWLYYGTAGLVTLFSFLCIAFRTIERSTLEKENITTTRKSYNTFKDPASAEDGPLFASEDTARTALETQALLSRDNVQHRATFFAPTPSL